MVKIYKNVGLTANKSVKSRVAYLKWLSNTFGYSWCKDSVNLSAHFHIRCSLTLQKTCIAQVV